MNGRTFSPNHRKRGKSHHNYSLFSIMWTTEHSTFVFFFLSFFLLHVLLIYFFFNSRRPQYNDLFR